MNYFSKTRFVFWLLIILVVINVAALTTIAFRIFPGSWNRMTPGTRMGQDLRGMLALNNLQSGQADSVMKCYRNMAGPLAAEIRERRALLLDELRKDNPDTTVLTKMVNEIGVLQVQMQKASVKQYLEMKKICDPEQCCRLSDLYFEMYGCPKEGAGMQKGRCGGKGMMHRHGAGGR